MRTVILKISLTATLMLFVLSLAQKAEAIPSFARKYRTSCTTCHIGFSKLNPFGEAYRLNGYRIPQSEEMVYVKEEPVSLGAPAWKKVWPQSVWPGQIPQNTPLSMMITQRLVLNDSANNQGVPQTNFRFPDRWKLFVGGDSGQMISYFGEFNLLEDGAVAGVEQLFLRFNDLLAGQYDILPAQALNLKVGRFSNAAQTFHEPTKRTLTKYLPSHYIVQSATIYLDEPKAGIEADGIINHRMYYALGLANGKNAADGGSSINNKDQYWRLTYKWRGLALDGSSEKQSEGLKQADNWVDNSVTLGAFGYYGRERISVAAGNNNFRRMGLDGVMQWANLDLSAALVLGKDNNPQGTSVKVNTHSWLTQAEYIFYPWLIGAMRYEQLYYNDDTQSIKRLVPSLSIYARANLRFVLEGVIYQDGNNGSNSVIADAALAF